MRIGYVASHYPAVSHAFLLREVRALRRAGVEVETFSIHRARPDELLAHADREEAARTYAVLPTDVVKLAVAHASALLHAPRRYFEVLAFAIGRANPGLRGRLWGLFYFAEAIVVWRAARRRGVRHLHAVFADVATDVALLVSRYGGPGWTWSLAVHGPVEFYDLHLNHLGEKLAAARFAVAISDFGRSQLMAIGDEQRWRDIHVVRCGIEPAAFAFEPNGRRGSAEEAQILCVGRLIHLKGQSLLIEAVAELRRRGQKVRLTLVGAGPKRDELERLTRRLGLERAVSFTGPVGQDEILGLYRSADIFCLPSMAEGVPVVLMEAMALQLPVVATRIMGIPELVEDGRTGILVPPGRVDLLVEALGRLLADRGLRERLGAEARRHVLSQFDVDDSARRLRDILATTVALS